jgi:drug/metabolite transporter (DMT)-like permease
VVKRHNRQMTPDNKGEKQRVTAALATTLLLWSSAFVAIRIAIPHFSPTALTLARLLVASLALGAAAALAKVRVPDRADIPRLAVCGLTGMAGYQLLLNAGERTVDAGTANLLVNTSPVIATVLAWMVLAQRPTKYNWAGIALGLTGAAIIAAAGTGTFALSRNALLVLGAAACQAAFFVLQRPLLDHYTAFEVTCYATWIGTIAALPAAGHLFADLETGIDGTAGASLLFLGVGPSAVAFVTWAYAQQRVSVAAATNTLYLAAPLTVALAWLTLGETPGPATAIGGLLVITGLIVTHRRPRQDDGPRPP